MENVSYPTICESPLGRGHTWLVVSSHPELYYERSDGVEYQVETGDLIVSVVCPSCERYKTFVAKPESAGATDP